MRGITSYILRQVLLATLIVAAGLTGIVMLIRSLRLIDFMVNRGLSLSTVVELTSLLIPAFLAIVLPVAVFAAVVFTYNRLIGDRELVVMRAVGVSQFGLAKPALLVALLAVAASYGLSLYVAPLTYRHFKDTQVALRDSYASVLLQEGRFNTPVDGVTVYVRSRGTGGELRGVLVHDNRDRAAPITWMAERGALVSGDDGPKVVMFNGNRQEVSNDSGRLTLVYFDQGSFDLEMFDNTGGARWRDPQERFLGELFNGDPNDANYRTYATQLAAEGHRRLSAPLYPLAFTLIALACLLSGDFNRQGQTVRILVAVSLAVAFQLAALGIVGMAAKAPLLTPLIYLLPIGTMVAAALVLRRRPRRPADDAMIDLAAPAGG